MYIECLETYSKHLCSFELAIKVKINTYWFIRFGLPTGCSVSQMHGEIKGKSPGAAYNWVRLINGI